MVSKVGTKLLTSSEVYDSGKTRKLGFLESLAVEPTAVVLSR